MAKGLRRCMGRTAVVRCKGVEVVITSRRLQNLDLAFFRSVGIEPTERKILVVKSSIHFRAAYGPIARQIIEVDAPGLVSPNLDRFDFHNVRRPIFPLDDI
jgi:microcystin degradation protein MlrC